MVWEKPLSPFPSSPFFFANDPGGSLSVMKVEASHDAGCWLFPLVESEPRRLTMITFALTDH